MSLFVCALAIGRGPDVILINGLHNPVLDTVFTYVTRLGEGWILVPLFVFSLFRRFTYSLGCLIVAAGHGILSSIIKRLIFPHVMRPAGVLDNDLLYFVPGVEVHTHNAFPSGHTATIFCTAVFASLLFRNRTAAIVLMLVALLVGISRIYLLQHFLLDVAGGALLGTAVSLVTWYLIERSRTPDWMSGSFTIRKQR
jgi:membrane-associated phospholipid phosphatase